jgi:hypothetical protein
MSAHTLSRRGHVLVSRAQTIDGSHGWTSIESTACKARGDKSTLNVVTVRSRLCPNNTISCDRQPSTPGTKSILADEQAHDLVSHLSPQSLGRPMMRSASPPAATSIGCFAKLPACSSDKRVKTQAAVSNAGMSLQRRARCNIILHRLRRRASRTREYEWSLLIVTVSRQGRAPAPPPPPLDC